ncbi:PAS domain S-box protein [Planktosalinus lacus]|uniref:histidine kinase n=1 Tax=Planktosalinus lacus TaxID=1526573 RepID=A0A8J2Y9M6_9FLAO|nr:PAS domain S-box protein [Planktosalinus lacus]GGD92669.1 hypothetical protein GCM10011312_15610 [Planktosalinus lacus]
MKIDKNKYRLLIVEDNPGDYFLVEDYLSEHIQKPNLTHCLTYQEAKDRLNDQSEVFDLILLDLSLPDISKEDLMNEMTRVVLTTPVIILTGYADLDIATRFLAQGVSDYMIKDLISPLVLYKSILYAMERHRFIQSLKQSEKRYMDLFQLSPSPLWVYDLETLHFLDVNQAAIAHYGFSKEEFLSMTLKDIRPKEDIHLLEEAVSAVKNNVIDFYRNTFRHKKKDGTIIYVEIFSNKIEINNKTAEVVLASDITEKLEQIQAIEIQNKKLKEIVWIQSHVVRAPVARLLALVDMIKNTELSPTEKDEMLEHIESSAKEMDTIINEIVEKSEDVDTHTTE